MLFLLISLIDLRIKQEPATLNDRDNARDRDRERDRERIDKLAGRLSADVYPSIGRNFESASYGNPEHLQHGASLCAGIAPLPPAHPPTPDLSPAQPTPAMWNSKINKAGTVTTPDGEFFFALNIYIRLY